MSLGPTPHTQDPHPSATSAADTGVTIQRPTVIALLYLATLFTGISGIVGLILAYIWRGEVQTPEWERTHHTYHIHTFWIGFAIFMLSFVGYFAAIFGAIADEQGAGEAPSAWFFVLVFGGMLVWLLAAVWFVVRCTLSLARAGRREPMPRPRTWLF